MVKRVILYGILGVTLLIGALFWKTILSTGYGYHVQQLLTGRPYLDTTPVPYRFADTDEFATLSTVTIGDIRIPVTFPVESSSSTDTYVVARGSEADGDNILLLSGFGVADMFTANADVDSEVTCTILSAQGEDICTSNYLLYKTMLETTSDDITLLSSREEKIAFSMLYILKATLSMPGTIDAFETEVIRGFRYNRPGETSWVVFFVDDAQYEMTTSLGREEFDYILDTIERVPDR